MESARLPRKHNDQESVNQMQFNLGDDGVLMAAPTPMISGSQVYYGATMIVFFFFLLVELEVGVGVADRRFVIYM